ncbi:MAG: sensor histidine kinase [Gemmatimonadetes bacterium]|nr:sensor histidine kinase [Gemmatimonadota bacterium]MCB9519176.1 sensor histidine kinase [Gemmatimonadales bacterium]
MDDTAPLLIWIITLTSLIVVAVMAVLLGALLWNQRRLAEESRRWGMHLLERLDAERHRIAAELHDDLVPRLSAVRRRAADADREGDADVLGEVVAGMRGLAHNLHPPALRHLDLGAALAELSEDWWEASGPRFRVQLAEALPSLDAQQNLTLYRIAQEAVANALTHAQATQVTIRLGREEGDLVLTIEDDGRGVADPKVLGQGFGTRSMRERAATLGGTIAFGTPDRGGTAVTCRIPVA